MWIEGEPGHDSVTRTPANQYSRLVRLRTSAQKESFLGVAADGSQQANQVAQNHNNILYGLAVEEDETSEECILSDSGYLAMLAAQPIYRGDDGRRRHKNPKI